MLGLGNLLIRKNSKVGSGPPPPTFDLYGYSNKGASSFSTNHFNLTGSKFTAPRNGTFSGVLFKGFSDGTARNMRAVIYSDSAGTPDTVITKSSVNTLIPTADGEYFLPLDAAPQVGGVEYWVKIWGETGTYTFWYDAATPDNIDVLNASGLYPNPPDPAGFSSQFGLVQSIQIQYFY